MDRTTLLLAALLFHTATPSRAGTPPAAPGDYEWLLVSDIGGLELPGPQERPGWQCPRNHLIAKGTLQLGHGADGGRSILLEEVDGHFTIEQRVRADGPTWTATSAPRSKGAGIAIHLAREQEPERAVATGFSWDRCEDLVRAAFSSGFLNSTVAMSGAAIVFHGEADMSLVLFPAYKGTSTESVVQPLVLWPNPTREQVWVQVEQGANWSLTSAHGSVVRSGTHRKEGILVLDLQGLRSGTYVLIVENGIDRRTAKLTVE